MVFSTPNNERVVPPDVQAQRDAMARALVAQDEPGHENDPTVGGNIPRNIDTKDSPRPGLIDQSFEDRSAAFSTPEEEKVAFSTPASERQAFQTPEEEKVKKTYPRLFGADSETPDLLDKAKEALDQIEPTWKGLGQAAGGFFNTIPQAMKSGAGQAASLLNAPTRIAMGETNPANVFKEALAQGEEWSGALYKVLPDDVKQALSTPSTEAGANLASLPFEPLMEGIQWLKEHGQETLADAAALALGIGGAAVMSKTGKAAKPKELPKPGKSPEAIAAEQLLKPEDLSKPLEFTKPEKPELTMSSEYDLSQPPKSAVYGPYAGPTQEPIGHPKYEGGIDYYPDNPAKAQEAVKASEIDQAWEQHAKEQEAQNAHDRAAAEPLDENWTPEQSGSIPEKGPTRILNNRSGNVPYRRGQSGQVSRDIIGPLETIGMAIRNAAIKFSHLDFAEQMNAAGDVFLEGYRGFFNDEVVNKLQEMKHQIVMMTPAEFGRAAKKMGPQDGLPHHRRTINEAVGEEGLNTPMELRMRIDPETGKMTVVGHNGRNRALYAEEKGISLLPVWIKLEDRDSFYTPSDIVKSKAKTMISENGEVVPKPKGLSAMFAEHTPKKTFAEAQGGPGGKQGGATNMGFAALFKKNTPTSSDFGFTPETVREMVVKSLLRSKSLEAFVQDLKLTNSGPNWMKEIVGMAEQFWANKDSIIREHPLSQFAKMSELSQKQSADLRPFEIFDKESLPHDKDGNLTPLTAEDDIGAWGKDLNTASRASQSHYDKMGGKWLKWVISNTQELANHGTKLYKEMFALVQGFEKLNRESKLKIRQVATSFDGLLNNKLVEAGLQWPTRKMLRDEGLTLEEIIAYESETKAVDRGWELLELIHKAIGKEPPPRIPGYFPRFWEGSWKVRITDAAGQLVAIRPFSNKGSALLFGSSGLEPGFTAKIIRPSTQVTSMNMVATLADISKDFAGRSQLGAAVVRMLMKMEESATRGIITEALERKSGRVGGYESERGIINNPVFGFGHNNKLITSYIKYMEDIAQFWANSQIATHVMGPFLEAAQKGHFNEAPNTHAAIQAFISRAVGHPINNIPALQHYAKEIAVSMGLPPNTIGNSAAAASSFLSLVMLKYNPGFWAVNYLQPSLVWPKLVELHMARMMDPKSKVGDVVGAMQTFLREYSALQTGKSSPDLARAKAWGVENGVIEVFQADHINPTKHGNPVAVVHETLGEIPNRVIEERGRTITFLTLYTYFKQVMPDIQALHAAALHTDDVMGNYKSMNAPGMYTDWGTAGRSIRPFALLTNTYLGNQITAITMVTKAVVEAAKDPKKAPMIIPSLVPILAWMGFYYAVGGVPAMFGAKEWDTIARTWNTLINPDNPLPESGDMLRESGASESSKYGFLGSALGVNIGPSVGSPALNQLGTAPAPQVAKSLAQLTYEAVSEIVGPGASKSGLRKATAPITPPYLRPLADRYFGSQPGLVPESGSLHATVTRSPQEEMAYQLTGKKAISEVERDARNKALARKEVGNKAWKKDTIDRIVSAGEDTAEGGKLMTKAVEAQRGFNRQTLTDAIHEEITRRNLARELLDLQRIQNGSNKAQQEWEMRQYENLRR